MTEQKGLILINTGTGKGKTTAALGTAIRAWGNGQKVLILQFIKGAWKYGELKAIEALEACNGNIEIRPMGDGFVFHNRKEDEAAGEYPQPGSGTGYLRYYEGGTCGKYGRGDSLLFRLERDGQGLSEPGILSGNRGRRDL